MCVYVSVQWKGTGWVEVRDKLHNGDDDVAEMIIRHDVKGFGCAGGMGGRNPSL